MITRRSLLKAMAAVPLAATMPLGPVFAQGPKLYSGIMFSGGNFLLFSEGKLVGRINEREAWFQGTISAVITQ